MMSHKVGQLFPLGQLVATPGALAKMEELGVTAMELLTRHAAGDWGDLCEEDKAENEFSLHRRLRLFSAYTVEGVRFWIISEADRSSTCILLPSEY